MQDSTGSGGSPSSRGLEEAETQGFGAKGCLTYFVAFHFEFLLWKSGLPGSTDEFKNQAFPRGRREVIKCANKHFHQYAEV